MSDLPPPEVLDLLTLHLVPGLGPRLTAALLERFGSARAALEAGPARLQAVPRIGAELARAIAHARQEVDLDGELGLMARHRVRLLALGSPGYPEALAQVHDPPHLLYVRGTLEERDARSVALVGSRSCTDYGRRMATRLAADLARAGWTVVSGLARGIDGAAHRAALQVGGRTLAVLAGGLSRIYPPEHRALADEVERSGALLTEASMRQESLASLFPARNRLISGLCQAVVLVEAAEKSGALITAEHAAEQGRTVLAVPGPADSPASGGTNALIRQGAVLCRGVEDVLEELHGVSGVLLAAKAAEAASPPPGLDDGQRRIWELLAAGPRHADEMVQQLGLGAGELAGLLLLMEMRKAVRRLPGNRYERC